MTQSNSNSDTLIRREIEKKYLPLFQNYEKEPNYSDGIPLQQLSEKLLQESSLPQARINSLLRRADGDRNDRVTYDEFVKQMTQLDDKLTTRLIAGGNRFLKRTVIAFVPGAQQQVFRPGDMPDGIESITEAFNCTPPPIFIPLITAIEIAVFIYYATKYPVTDSTGCPMDSPLIFDPKKRWEVWRFLTYMFLHQGYSHLIANCLVQLFLGVLLELVHKLWRVGPIYLLGVIAGSLASSCFDPRVALVGASGGCCALIGAYIASAIVNWKEMQKDWKSSPRKILSSGVFRLVLLFVIVSVQCVLAVRERFFLQEKAKVSLAAHVAGFAAGLLVGVKLLKNFNESRWEKVLSWIFVAIYIVLMVAGILYNIFCSSEVCYRMSQTTPSP